MNIPYDKITSIGMRTFIKYPVANCFWRINRYCNYNCSYCWPHAHTSKKDFLDEDVYLLAIDKIVSGFRDNGFPHINWGWVGGEITFNPSFLPILETIQLYVNKDEKMATNITTNLSQPMKWWDKFVKFTKKFVKVKINGSWHEEYLQAEDKQKLFRDKLLFLRDNGIKVQVNAVLLPTKLEILKKVIDFFSEVEIPMNLKACRQKGKVVDGYTKEEMKLLTSQREYIEPNIVFLKDVDENEYGLSSLEQLIANNSKSYEGWNCSAGFQSITIYEDGTVTRGVSCKKEILGTITNGFTLNKNITKCITKQACDCSADLKMPKTRN